MAIPSTVAIVGRPNVGKSALFNRLARRKIAIVHDQPGVTRDRISAECQWGERAFTVFDTGGIGSAVDADFTEQVRTEVDIAIATSDVLLFVVDGQAGLTPVDHELAKQLRRVKKPLILVINKIDHDKHAPLENEFARLGFETFASISAEHGRGIEYLVSKIETFLPEQSTEPSEQEELAPEIPIAIVGRPNVGKSSLINAILRDKRTLVSNIAGTTRDAVDVPYARGEQRYVLIDTAGIRPRGKVDNSVEVFSVMRSERSIRRADLCVLVVDASAGVTAQDKKIAGLIQEARKPCVIALNKSDLIESRDSKGGLNKSFIEEIQAELFFLDYAPLLLLSAKTGDSLGRLFKAVEAVIRGSRNRISTGRLNRMLKLAMEETPPPLRSGRRLKVLYVTQVEPGGKSAVPQPVFTFFVNDGKLLTQTYQRFLESKIRSVEPFEGLPLLLEMRGREPRRK